MLPSRPTRGISGAGWQLGGWSVSSNTLTLVQKAIWTGSWHFLTQSAFCAVALRCWHGPPLCVRAQNECLRIAWADLDSLLDNVYNRKHLWVRVRSVSAPKYVRLSIELHMHPCVLMKVQVATSFPLGSLNVGHRALRASSEMFGWP